MASNISRLAEMNEALTAGFAPYVRRRLEELQARGTGFVPRLPQRCKLENLDAHGALYAIVHNFDAAFKIEMMPHLRAAASSALAGRNASAHPVTTPDDNLTLSAILGAVQLLEFTKAQPELLRMTRHRDELSRKISQSSGFAPTSRTKTLVPLSPLSSPTPSAVARNSRQAVGEGYFVYENFVWKKAVIHEGACSHCNYGAGRTMEKSARNGRWFGAFATVQDAWLAARITGEPDRRFCAVCIGRGDSSSFVDEVCVFDGNEAEYRDWIANNPEGFVVNSRRKFDPQYVVLHLARCRSINSDRRSGYTDQAYIKICAVRREALENCLIAMRSSNEAFSKQCAICDP